MITGPDILKTILIVMPEIILAFGGMGLLVAGVFQQRENVVMLSHFAAMFMLLSISMLIAQGQVDTTIVFGGQFIQDSLAQYAKMIVLVLSIMTLVGTKISIYKENIARFEYPVLIVLSVLGMMIMVSAKSFLSLFMGIELQSLALYILAALRRDEVRSSEAGMKYFILGALSTGMLLYGISLIYGATGEISFDGVKQVIQGAQGFSIGLKVGFIFVLAGIIFKVSAAPFHMWTPDVYEGSPLSITVFLAAVPKIAAFVMFIRFLMDPFLSMVSHWSYVLALISVLSMVIGFFSLLYQTSIKRFIAYSTIANAGFSLMGLLTGDPAAVQATLLYVTLYAITILGFLLCILLLVRRGEKVETISDLAGISKVYPALGFVMVLLLFSLAGVPPLAGFLAKLYVFKIALQTDMLWLPIIAVLSTVLGAGYYLWLIKVITMDEPVAVNWSSLAHVSENKSVHLLILMITLFILLFFIKPNLFLQYLTTASNSLFIK